MKNNWNKNKNINRKRANRAILVELKANITIRSRLSVRWQITVAVEFEINHNNINIPQTRQINY
jgi:hypothetical protein